MPPTATAAPARSRARRATARCGELRRARQPPERGHPARRPDREQAGVEQHRGDPRCWPQRGPDRPRRPHGRAGVTTQTSTHGSSRRSSASSQPRADARARGRGSCRTRPRRAGAGSRPTAIPRVLHRHLPRCCSRPTAPQPGRCGRRSRRCSRDGRSRRAFRTRRSLARSVSNSGRLGGDDEVGHTQPRHAREGRPPPPVWRAVVRPSHL